MPEALKARSLGSIVRASIWIEILIPNSNLLNERKPLETNRSLGILPVKNRLEACAAF